MTYHLRQIFPQGTYGELSKVYEELDEYQESLEQNNKIMAILELSDVYGALEAIVEIHGYSMSDLAKMSEATKRSFKSGSRQKKEPHINVSKCYSPINWMNISKAIDFYVRNGFRYIEVPWTVSSEAITSTMPFNRLSYSTRIGHLVGSAEQSFVELMMQGKISQGERYVAATPCFRDEIVDELHQNYFFKVELFKENSDFSTAMTDSYNVVCFAKSFYKECFELEVSLVWDGIECDLILNGIEIGSYGARKFRDKFWTYGTGIAEPRFSQALIG